MSSTDIGLATDPWRQRVDSGDWDAIRAELDSYGGALLPQLLSPEEASQIRGLYDEAGRFRSTINMGRHRFGEGEYRYFARPYPQAVERLSRGIEFDIHPCQGIGNVAIKRTQEQRVLVAESGVKAAARKPGRSKKVRKRRGIIAARPEHVQRALDRGFRVETSRAAAWQPQGGFAFHFRYMDQLVFNCKGS